MKAMSSISEGMREFDVITSDGDLGDEDEFFNWRSNSLPAFIEVGEDTRTY